ncbi:enolase C-terminal domain-like protein [Salinibacterium sp. M195]|uniref:enolase C-terminal domain-like protein n=1 Tax=Salinibacterium sp. M195 TaxID=2583374 RepID=UPI001C631D99|nr:enolase C-terminal domain-like protein [Salinibacterium sp. M195]QYH36363.1 hypothetical protein FFT87_10600 [Salinibacterium sp. M195]
MSADRNIVRVATATRSLSLPEPLQLGAMTVTRREYCAVQVESADGYVGQSYALSREAPMAEIVSRLIAPTVLAQDSGAPEIVWDKAYRGSAIVGRVGLVRRAIGMVDVATWDIASQRAGLPLWQMLGTSPDPRPTMLVAAYPTPGRSVRDVVDEVVSQAQEGWPLVKISRSPDNDFMRELISTLRQELPEKTGLVVDVGFGWNSSDEALNDVSQWGDPELAWLEDPLLPEDVEGCARLRRGSGLTIAVGDEVTDPLVLRSLVESEAIDVLRLDVIAVGGITQARILVEWAAERGTEVSCHVYPEVSVHLGVGVETFNRSVNPYDPSPSLVRGGPEFVAGYAVPPTTAGLGFTLDPALFDFGVEKL